MNAPARKRAPQMDPFVTVDGRRWLACPVGGPECARVLADLGQMAADVMDVHLALTHSPPPSCCGHCGR